MEERKYLGGRGLVGSSQEYKHSNFRSENTRQRVAQSTTAPSRPTTTPLTVLMHVAGIRPFSTVAGLREIDVN